MNTKWNTVVHARWFETTILVVILLAGVLAGLETSPALVARSGAWLEALDFLVLAIFIGIVMNSMSEMHAEIAERDRRRHVTETGAATIDDELRLLERQIESLKDQATRARQRLRQKPPHTSEP